MRSMSEQHTHTDRAKAVLRVLTACAALDPAGLGPDDRAVFDEASRAASQTVAPLLAKAVMTLAESATGEQLDDYTRAAVEAAVAAEPTVDACLEALDGNSRAAVLAFQRGFWHGRGGCAAATQRPTVEVSFEEICSLADIPEAIVAHAEKIERVKLRAT